MKKYIRIFTFMLSGILVFPACESLVKDLNDDPNNFTDAPAELMITGAQLANIAVQEGELARLAMIFSNHMTGSDRQYISYNDYVITTGDFDNMWNTMYSEGVAQCRIIEAKASAAGKKDLEAVAKIVRANMMGTAASLWGAVPFNQAADDKFPTPVYDSQADVYNGVVALLDNAIALLGAKGKGQVYAGTTAVSNGMDWYEVAHTLKARYLLHQKKYAEAITAATNGISGASGDWMASHAQGSEGTFNLYYHFMDYERVGYLSASGAHLPALLDTGNAKNRGNAKTDESARYAFYFVEDVYFDTDPNFVDGMFAYTAAFPLATYVENQLIIAEAEVRQSNTANALTALNNARAAHEAKYGPGKYQSYILTDFGPAGIVPGASVQAAMQGEIMEERYISLYGQMEAWTDLRRTKNELNVPLKRGSQLPQRFMYPQQEVNANPNTPAVGQVFDPLPLFQ